MPLPILRLQPVMNPSAIDDLDHIDLLYHVFLTLELFSSFDVGEYTTAVILSIM